MCDGVNTLNEVGAIAALAQCLVERMERTIADGGTVAAPPNWTVRENKWRASRFGLEAELITDPDGTSVALRDVAADLVDSLCPVAADLGCRDELISVLDIMENGNGADRQRMIRGDGGSSEDVVHLMAQELRANRTTTR